MKLCAVIDCNNFYASCERVLDPTLEGTPIAVLLNNDGDLLVIDKSVEPYGGCIAVCFIAGEFTVKTVRKEKDKATLMPENPNYRPIVIEGDAILIIRGVVNYSIKNHKRNQKNK